MRAGADDRRLALNQEQKFEELVSLDFVAPDFGELRSAPNRTFDAAYLDIVKVDVASGPSNRMASALPSSTFKRRASPRVIEASANLLGGD